MKEKKITAVRVGVLLLAALFFAVFALDTQRKGSRKASQTGRPCMYSRNQRRILFLGTVSSQAGGFVC